MNNLQMADYFDYTGIRTAEFIVQTGRNDPQLIYIGFFIFKRIYLFRKTKVEEIEFLKTGCFSYRLKGDHEFHTARIGLLEE